MSFPRYPKYKDSGVEWLGEVPEHWQHASLRHACSRITDGSHFSPQSTDEGKCYVTVRDLNAGIIDLSGAANISCEDYERLEKAGCRPAINDVLFSKDGTVGKVAIVKNDDFVALSSLAIISPQVGKLTSKYLFYFLQSSNGGNQIESLYAGAALRRITLDAIVGIWLPLPGQTEQTRIAAFLDQETAKIDELIAEQQRLIELLKEKRQAVISNAVTQGLHNQSIPLKRLKFVIDGIETGFTPNSHNFPATTGQCGVLKSGCVNGGVFDPNENKLLADDVDPPSDLEVKRGDVLMSRASGSSELIGSVAQVREQPAARLFLSDKTFRAQVKKSIFDAAFFVVVMGSSFLRNQLRQIISGAEGLAKNVTQSDIREFQMPFPPLAEQRAIVTHLNNETIKFDTLTAEAQRAIDLLQERRTALISAAVTGQIDVRQASN